MFFPSKPSVTHSELNSLEKRIPRRTPGERPPGTHGRWQGCRRPQQRGGGCFSDFGGFGGFGGDLGAGAKVRDEIIARQHPHHHAGPFIYRVESLKQRLNYTLRHTRAHVDFARGNKMREIDQLIRGLIKRKRVVDSSSKSVVDETAE